jgi:hypothetical protein
VGDDAHLVLVREEAATVEVLRSIDGATVREWDWRDVFETDQPPPAIFSHIVAVRGTLALWYTHPPQQHGRAIQLRPRNDDPEAASVTVIDLARGRKLWSQTVSRGSWVIKLDNDRLGVLSPEGALSVRDWESGASLAEHRVEVPPQLANVYVITDAQTSFILASGRIDDPRLLQAIQIRGAYRRPVVNGWMHAIARETGRHLWQQRLDNVGLILDQPRHVPLLVTSYTVVEQQNRNTGVLKCLDRRTGEMLYEYSSQAPYIYHTVQCDAPNRRIEVVTQDKIIRFQYTPQDPGE